MRACTVRCGRGFDGVALPWSATNRNPPAAPKRNRYGAVLAANIVIAAVSKAKQRRSKHALCAEEPDKSPFMRFLEIDTSVFETKREYATRTALERAFDGITVNLKDLSRKYGPNVPLASLESPVYRIIAFTVAFFAYPSIVRFLRGILQMGVGESTADLADVVTDFVTVETFVFGSYAGVTLSVQMQRLAELQTECAKECAHLSGMAEHTVNLFASLDKSALSAESRATALGCEKECLNALWHHSDRLAFGTRGEELMDIAERKRRLDSVSNYRVSLLKWGRNRRESSKQAPLYEPELQLCLQMTNTMREFRAGRLSREGQEQLLDQHWARCQWSP
ncbi:unnamed protein product [Effrenium voratum]|nr:unnamed protein product [Effrenium voratum]